MRFYERTLKMISIAPQMHVTDSLGGVAEGFSEETSSVRASVIPSTASLKNHATGRIESRTLCLLVPLDTAIEPGDGICVDDAAPNWRCTSVEKWSAHKAVQAEKIA